METKLKLNLIFFDWNSTLREFSPTFAS